MASVASTNGTSGVLSKTSQKKRSKAESAANASTGTATPAGDLPSAMDHTTESNGADGGFDSPYLKELNKNIRNIHKKLAGSSKTDAIIADNPGKSVDELVAEKKINADQRAQVLKKPALQQQLAHLEEQAVQCGKICKDYEDRLMQERSALAEAHRDELSKAIEEAAFNARLEALKRSDEDLLVLSQFLHAATIKRQTTEASSHERQAFEAILLHIYQGNSAALNTLKNLILGAEEKVVSIEGEILDFTYSQVKQSSIDDAPTGEESVAEATEEPQVNLTLGQTERDGATLGTAEEDLDSAKARTETDPTIAHAGLTELEDTLAVQEPSNGTTEFQSITIPQQSSTTAASANAVAEHAWDPETSTNTNDSAAVEGWVEVPRDPAETDTGLAATPAAIQKSSSWAEEVTEGAAAEEKAAAENDGFEQVVHHTGRERGRARGRGGGGEFRGRGRSEGYRGGRGRGDRGDGGERRGGRGRGRGEGSYRGERRGGGRGRDGQSNHTPKPAETGTDTAS